jgi:NADH:ubiquinone oxidoreductase subunit 3 (subunit A)
MQKVMTRVLAVMLVASFVLAVVSFLFPTPAAALCYHTWEQKFPYECGTCPSDPGNMNLNYYIYAWCEDDPCIGWGPICHEMYDGCEFCS